MRSVRGLRCSVRRESRKSEVWRSGGSGRSGRSGRSVMNAKKLVVDPDDASRAQLVMRTFRVILPLLVLVACGPATRAQSPSRTAPWPATWALAGKAVAVTGPHAMVTTGHPLATEVGRKILEQGGNAIDAAVAVGFALEVVLPSAGNIGGGGFILCRDTAGTVCALDYRETAPGGATRNMYLDSAGNPTDASVTGHLAAGVPGSVAGM